VSVVLVKVYFAYFIRNFLVGALKMQDVQMTDQVAVRENARHRYVISK